MSRPSVCVVTWFYDHQPGFLDFRYRIECLARRFDTTLVLRSARFVPEFQDLPLALRIVEEPGCGTRSLLRYQWRVARLLRREAPDRVLLLGAQLALAAWGLDPARTALYWNEHPTHTFHGGRWGVLSRLANAALVRAAFAGARRAGTVMPIGEAHREDLLRRRVDPARCRLVHMGVHERFAAAAARAPASVPGRPLALIYTGTVAEDRGRDVMLEGLAIARRAGVDCTLTLVGAGPAEQAYCLARGRELGIAAALTVLGRVPGDAIPGLLAAADAGVCLWKDRVWWRFNPPTKLFEYLVAGLPVLASRIRTHTDYVEDGVHGLIFDYAPAGFADAIARLAADPAALARLSAAAARAGARFRWQAIEPQFLAALDAA